MAHRKPEQQAPTVPYCAGSQHRGMACALGIVYRLGGSMCVGNGGSSGTECVYWKIACMLKESMSHEERMCVAG